MGEEFPSPNGKYILYLSCNEMRMSLWVCSPTLVEADTKRVLYDAPGDHDAGDIKWSDDSTEVRFYQRIYPNGSEGKYACLRIAHGEATLEYES
ncbi:MAG: hypothetical protein LCH81_04165 [Bacteroidetes bacterium]|nr:hypothetical protein [Bacteroidota bacterium]